MARARLIYSDVPGALPADFVLPPDLDLEISSVYARINGAAAASAFRPCLTVLSQAGNLIARVPLDETYAVGDTGDATWSPFLRTSAAASPAGGPAIPWARRSKGFDAANQSIANNSFTDVTFNHDYNMAAGESGNGIFSAGTNRIDVLVDGVYSITAQVNWFDALNATWFMGLNTVFSAWIGGSFFAGQGSTTETGLLSEVHNLVAGTSVFLTLWQISGAAKNLDSAYLELHQLGTYTGTDYTAMNPDQ